MGTADNATVPRSEDITLRCDPVAGFPAPTLRWDRVPASSVQGVDGDSITIIVRNIDADFCIDCIGESTSGEATDTECVRIRKFDSVGSGLAFAKHSTAHHHIYRLFCAHVLPNTRPMLLLLEVYLF